VKPVVVMQHGIFWLIGDIGSFGVVIFGEGISNKGNHFLNKMFKIGLE
jgi:hypothetical protein